MAKGQKTGGRVAGTPNKVTTSIKAAFLLAFEDLGGWPKMVEWVRSDPKNEGEFYKLVTKLIPTEISGIDGGAIKTESSIKSEDKEIIERFMKERK